VVATESGVERTCRPHSTPPHGYRDRLDVLLDAWPSPADADAHLRAVAAAAWTADPARPWCADAAAGIAVDPEDAAAAAVLGARLRHVGIIERHDGGVRAWRGVAAVPAHHLLASVPDGHWAAVVGAGSPHAALVAVPVAAAAVAVGLIARVAGAWPARRGAAAEADTASAPAGGRSWLLRLRFGHAPPTPPFVEGLLVAAGLHVRQVSLAPASSRSAVGWAHVSASDPATVARAIAALHRVHRVAAHSWVVL
jgi:hypothetical protein